ncbi:DUF6069 family protein [Kibdelosporangium philippinense]|uniref:DUF6069 family protein n=1 Tax=Kibdelosporangium philippinense TaxID=211113 RepID=A0ABS8Z960_9PSEU|nr:DUF6069 family protein [Kibdelosporangium philippinense]MCE7004424.1 DUF6069 family protein [Kibdelosporangium philippinense]
MTKTLAPVKPVVVTGFLIAAAVVACAVNIGIAALAHAAGASEDFGPLTIGAYVPYSLYGFAAGAIGWAVLRWKASDPAKVLRWLVPTVLVLSCIPDLAMFFSDFEPNANAVGIIALLLMHTVVAVCAVLALGKALPVTA